MENPSIYNVFEQLWKHILSKFNNYATSEALNDHAEDNSNPHSVNAEQVGALPITGGVMEGEINMNYQTLGGLLDPTTDDEAATKAYVDRVIESVDTSDKISKAGDNMLGNLSMGGYKITGLGDPTSNTDAANKSYVDEQIKSINVTGQFNTLSADLTSQMATKLGWVELWKTSNTGYFGEGYIYPSNLSNYNLFAIVTSNGTFFYSTQSQGQYQTMLHITIDYEEDSLKVNMRHVWVSGGTLWISNMHKENLWDDNGYDTDNQTVLVPYGVYGVC